MFLSHIPDAKGHDLGPVLLIEIQEGFFQPPPPKGFRLRTLYSPQLSINSSAIIIWAWETMEPLYKPYVSVQNLIELAMSFAVFQDMTA
jgi:hypothetical protein